MGGSATVGAAQDYLLSKLPDSWRENFEQEKDAAQTQHPFGFWLGGLAPLALTANPIGAAESLPANATSFDKLMANPITKRLFPAGMMGGTETLNEYREGEPLDPSKIAVSTAFGLFFPGQNRIGQKISDLGTAPIRAFGARPAAVTADEPTVAQAGDMKVAGPGITEDVYQGQEQMAPQAEASAIQAAQAEEAPRPPDVHAIARQMHPELFDRYDALVNQRDSFRNTIDNINNPPQSAFDALDQRYQDLSDQLEGTKNLNEQRRIRTLIRTDVGDEYAKLQARQAAFASGEAEETPGLAAARQQLMTSDYALRDMLPEIQAAYRRAADHTGTELVSTDSTPSAPEAAATAGEAQPPEAPPQPAQPTAEEQSQNIATDVKRQLVEAGVPQDQAESRSLLEAAFFDTMSKRGQFGTAQELYDQHGPIWKQKVAKARPSVLELAQTSGKELDQSARGKISIAEGRKPLITLFKDADFSTLVHEGAHSYLEILGQYAEHPEAGSALRDDWQTIKDWLRVNDRSEIKTRQHERFARGFEQYVREGVAPSPRLARAFAQFKQWMTTVYRSLQGLGKPISDDIRNVFDRMLAEEPHPTVILPDSLERETSLSDVHSQDAAMTEPQEAEAAMDRVIAERNQAIEDHQPNVRTEIESKRLQRQTGTIGETAKPAAEAGEGAVGAGRVGDDRGGPNSESGGRLRSDAGVSQQPSGGEAGREGAGVANGGGAERSGRPGGVPARESAGNAFATVADPIWERPESGLTDKAGNIVLRNVTPENFGQALVESAERNADFQSVRGQMIKGQIWDLATELGLDLENTNLEGRLARIVGKFNDLAPVALALRRLTRESAKNVWQIASIAAKSQSDADAAQLAAALSRHDMIQSALSGATASWGRTGSAFHNLRSFPEGMELDQALRQTTGRTLYQLKMMAKMLAGLEGKSEADQTAALSQFVKDSGQYSFGRMILEYWVNGLISGIPTHVTYSIGNTVSTATGILLDTPTAAAIGALRKAAGRRGEVIPLGEAAACAKGAVKGFAPAVTAALEATSTGAATTLPGQGPGMTPKIPGVSSLGAGSLKEQATFADAAHALYALGRGLKDGIVTGGAIATVGGPAFQREYSLRGAIPNFRVFGAQVPVGDIARIPGRMVAANHSFFTGLGYAIEMNGLEYRQAWNEGYRGDKLTERITQLRLNRSPEMMEQASKAALEGALMGPGGALTRWLSEGLNKSFNIPGLGQAPYFKFIDPFVHISANILNKAIVERTPAGILSPSMRADLSGKNGSVAQDLASAKMMVGTAVAVTFGWLAAEGLVTGSGPTDPRQQAVWRNLNGYQPHSVKLNDQWIAVNRLGPIGMLVGMAADLYDVARAASQEDTATAAGLFVHGVAQNILDESFMRGPADLLKAFEDRNFARAYVQNLGASFLPASVEMSYLTRSMDPYSRQARTFLDKLRAKLPFDVGFGRSTDLSPKRDLWGEPIQNARSLDQLGLTSIWISKQSTDRVNREMLRLGVAPSPVERRVRGQTLSDQQYDDYARLAGRLTKMDLDRVVNSQYWSQIPDAQKRDVIEHAFKANRGPRPILCWLAIRGSWPMRRRARKRMPAARTSGRSSDPVSLCGASLSRGRPRRDHVSSEGLDRDVLLVGRHVSFRSRFQFVRDSGEISLVLQRICQLPLSQ